MATYKITTRVDIGDVLYSVPAWDEADVLLEAFESFDIESIGVALGEFCGSQKGRAARVLGDVGYFNEEDFLLQTLEIFDINNVNAVLRRFFGSQGRDKLPDFVDAEKL